MNGVAHDLAANATPPMVSTSAAIFAGPSGSPSANADTVTPITGTSMVAVAATEAGSRSSAANQRQRRCRTARRSCRRSPPSRRIQRGQRGPFEDDPASATGRQPRPICQAAEVAPGSWIGHFFRKMVPSAKPIAPPSASKMPGSFARLADISLPPNSNDETGERHDERNDPQQRHPLAEQRPGEQGGRQRRCRR